MVNIRFEVAGEEVSSPSDRPERRVEFGLRHPLLGYQDADGLLDVPALRSFNGMPHAYYNAAAAKTNTCQACCHASLPVKRQMKGGRNLGAALRFARLRRSLSLRQRGQGGPFARS